MDDLQRQRDLRRVRDELLSVPNCSTCLHQMKPVEVGGEAAWQCLHCVADRPSR